jgi:hypothetical protein
MKSIFKWALLVLILAEIVLVRFDILDIRTAIGIIVSIELLLFLVAFRQVFWAVRTYKHDRRTGLDGWTALENGLEILLPKVVSRVLTSELKLWYCLGIWLLKRTPKSENYFTYHKSSVLRIMPIVFLFTTPIEVFLLELILPWTWLQWLLIVIAVYAFFWIAGLYASMVSLPHELGDSAVRLSYGILARAEIPYTDIENVTLSRNSEGTGRDGLKVPKKEAVAQFVVGGNTNVTLKLKRSIEIQGWLGPTAPVSSINIAVDEPERFVNWVKKMVATSP